MKSPGRFWHVDSPPDGSNRQVQTCSHFTMTLRTEDMENTLWQGKKDEKWFGIQETGHVTWRYLKAFTDYLFQLSIINILGGMLGPDMDGTGLRYILDTVWLQCLKCSVTALANSHGNSKSFIYMFRIDFPLANAGLCRSKISRGVPPIHWTHLTCAMLCLAGGSYPARCCCRCSAAGTTSTIVFGRAKGPPPGECGDQVVAEGVSQFMNIFESHWLWWHLHASSINNLQPYELEYMNILESCPMVASDKLNQLV